MVNIKRAIQEFQNAGQVLGLNNPHATGSLGGHHGLTQVNAPVAAVTTPHQAPTLGL